MMLHIVVVHAFSLPYSSIPLYSSVSSVTQSCPTLCNPMDCSMPGFPVHHQLSELTQTHVHQVGDAIQQTIASFVIPFSSRLQSFPASGSFPVSQFFALGGQSVGVSASVINPSNEYSGLISFRLDLLAVQGTLKSLFQHHSSKASILWRSVFFIVQLSHVYMTTGKTIDLTTWTFVDKVMSPLFSMLSNLVITFLPRSKLLLISWLHSPSAVILEPPKIKSVTVSIVSPSICSDVMRPR